MQRKLPRHDALIHAYLETPGDHTLVGFATFMREQLGDELRRLRLTGDDDLPASYYQGVRDAERLVRGVD